MGGNTKSNAGVYVKAIYYVIFDSAESLPSAAQIVAGMAWGPALAAGSDTALPSSGVQSFGPNTDLPRAEVRIAFVAYDDVEDEYSNVVVSEPVFIPRAVVVPAESLPGVPVLLYPPEGSEPLTDEGYTARILDFPWGGGAVFDVPGTVDIDAGWFTAIADDALKMLADPFVYVQLRKGDRRVMTPASRVPEML